VPPKFATIKIIFTKNEFIIPKKSANKFVGNKFGRETKIIRKVKIITVQATGSIRNVNNVPNKLELPVNPKIYGMVVSERPIKLDTKTLPPILGAITNSPKQAKKER
jgi:hypothetical protein